MNAKIIEIVAEILNEDITVDSTVDNTSAWDSMAYMAILSTIEDEFGIEISEANINNFASVRSIIREIENAKK